MISSAQVGTTLHSQTPARRIHPKLAIVAGGIGFITLITIILSHLGTYDVALAHASAQQYVRQIQQTATAIPTATAQATSTAQAVPASGASQALVRIAQADIHQYASQAEHDQWWQSACSAASLTEVINAYGHQYRITDILHIESGIGAITPESGLLTGGGIDQTAIWFGLETTTLNNPSVDQVITTANKGMPVIVSFPPEIWPGGHILVVRGGNSTTIQLADSSNLDLQTVTRNYFSRFWRGFAKVLTPSKYIVTNKPTVTAAAINNMLAAYQSPAQGMGQMIYNTAVQYGLDPAYTTATFGHESGFGTHGEATKSKSPGNLRCIANARCADGYAQFDTWQAGFEALCRLLAGDLYAGDMRIVPETIIPRFAPAADNNDEQAYINALKHVIDVLRAGGTSI